MVFIGMNSLIVGHLLCGALLTGNFCRLYVGSAVEKDEH